MSITEFTTFLGWVTLINFGLLLFSSLMIFLIRDFAARLHGKMFDLPPEAVKTLYFNYLGNFKVMVIVFNLTPYIALKVMGF